MSVDEIEDLIAELEETVILLQSRPGNHEAVSSLEQQIESLRKRLNTL